MLRLDLAFLTSINDFDIQYKSLLLSECLATFFHLTEILK